MQKVEIKKAAFELMVDLGIIDPSISMDNIPKMIDRRTINPDYEPSSLEPEVP